VKINGLTTKTDGIQEKEKKVMEEIEKEMQFQKTLRSFIKSNIDSQVSARKNYLNLIIFNLRILDH
jgi:hypothetical protein